MTVLPTPVAPSVPRRGRGLIVWGSVLLVVSVLVGIVGTSLSLGRVDFSEFDRDVVISGPDAVLIPGRIPFSVDEPLAGTGSGEMTVGIATTSTGLPVPSCTLATAAGRSVRLSTTGIDDTLMNDVESRFRVVGRARLEPGDYVAECLRPGEPSQATGSGEFTVGRTLGADEMGDVLRPFFWFIGVVGVSGLLFVLGLVMLIVGLVMRNRSRRDGGGVGGVPAAWAQGWPQAAAPGPWTGAAGPALHPPPGQADPAPLPPIPPAGPPVSPPAAPAPWTAPGPTGPPLGPPPASPPTGPDSGWPTQPGRR